MRGLTLRLLLALVLVVSTAQGFIAQTHVHARPAVGVAGAATAVVDALAREDARCVLCDVAGHAPAGVPAASPFSLAPPSFLPAPAPAAADFAPDSLASHHWHGRGPPVA